jgi:succinate-acetate transporter protein
MEMLTSDPPLERAQPGALGLAAFGLTTVLLSLVNAGVLPSSGLLIVLPMALIFGGLTQIVVGVLEFQRANTFGGTSSCCYGAFWIWFASLQFLNSAGVIDLPASHATFGAALVLWGVLTLYLWICTFRQTRVTFVVFLTLWIDYFILGSGTLLGSPQLLEAGGWLGIVCGGTALYGSFGTVANATFGRCLLPLGAPLA